MVVEAAWSAGNGIPDRRISSTLLQTGRSCAQLDWTPWESLYRLCNNPAIVDQEPGVYAFAEYNQVEATNTQGGVTSGVGLTLLYIGRADMGLRGRWKSYRSDLVHLLQVEDRKHRFMSWVPHQRPAKLEGYLISRLRPPLNAHGVNHVTRIEPEFEMLVDKLRAHVAAFRWQYRGELILEANYALEPMRQTMKEQMKALGLRQSELARKLGVTPTSVFGWLLARTAPRSDRFFLLIDNLMLQLLVAYVDPVGGDQSRTIRSLVELGQFLEERRRDVNIDAGVLSVSPPAWLKIRIGEPTNMQQICMVLMNLGVTAELAPKNDLIGL